MPKVVPTPAFTDGRSVPVPVCAVAWTKCLEYNQRKTAS